MELVLSFADAEALIKKYGLDVVEKLADVVEEQPKTKAAVRRGYETEYGKTRAFDRLIRVLGLSYEEATRVCEKHGYYGGATAYLLKQLNMTHEEAYEKGVVEFLRPIDQCDAQHKKILDEYRRIRNEIGIKEANKYFMKANMN